MNVLMITGDRKLLEEGSNAHERLALQRSAVERLQVVYWGRGAFFDALRVRGEYDVVTVQDPLWRGLVGLFLAHKLGAKLNVQVHMDLHALSFARHVLAQIVLKHADTIRVASEKLRKQVESMGVKAKITVLPVFVDISRFKNIIRSKSQPGTQKTILWIGRFEKEKNPKEALSVLKSVQEAGIDAGLVMLGAGSLDGELRLENLRLESAYRLKNKVVFSEGWQDPLNYLASADVVVSTSKHESWGASIVEALAARVPVVVRDVGIAREAGARVVEDGKLADTVVEVLKSGEQGMLRLNLLPAEEWAVQWRHSLI